MRTSFVLLLILAASTMDVAAQDYSLSELPSHQHFHPRYARFYGPIYHRPHCVPRRCGFYGSWDRALNAQFQLGDGGYAAAMSYQRYLAGRQQFANQAAAQLVGIQRLSAKNEQRRSAKLARLRSGISPFTGQPKPEVRLWTDDTGQYSADAKLIQVHFTHVTLRLESGRQVNVPWNRLSRLDAAYAAAYHDSLVAASLRQSR